MTSEAQNHPQALGTVEDVRVAVQDEMARHGITQSAVAKESGVSASILSSWMGAKYQGDNDAVAQKLRAWLALRGTASAVVVPDVPTWRSTPTSEEIWDAMSYAQTFQDIAAVYGGAGFGKTKTAEEYKRRGSNVWMVTGDPTTANVAVFLEEIALALGLRDFPLHPARLRRAIVGKLKGTRGLLIVDEAQHLSKLALEQARSLHDATGVGLAVLGNARVYDRMYGGGKASEDFAQVFSRVGKRLPLRQPKEGDVRAIADHYGVKGADEVRFLVDCSKRPGALRLVTKVLREAVVLAAGAGSVIDVSLLRASLVDLMGADATAQAA